MDRDIYVGGFVIPHLAMLRSEIFGGNILVALSLLFGKIYPTMN
jgi:hypothetical protein